MNTPETVLAKYGQSMVDSASERLVRVNNGRKEFDRVVFEKIREINRKIATSINIIITTQPKTTDSNIVAVGKQVLSREFSTDEIFQQLEIARQVGAEVDYPAIPITRAYQLEDDKNEQIHDKGSNGDSGVPLEDKIIEKEQRDSIILGGEERFVSNRAKKHYKGDSELVGISSERLKTEIQEYWFKLVNRFIATFPDKIGKKHEGKYFDPDDLTVMLLHLEDGMKNGIEKQLSDEGDSLTYLNIEDYKRLLQDQILYTQEHMMTYAESYLNLNADDDSMSTGSLAGLY